LFLVLAGALHAEEHQVQDVIFTARADGTEQRYALVRPAGFQPTESHDLLIALHGHGSDRWQFVRDARDECRAARDVAAKYRMLFVAPDYRARTSWMGPLAEADVVQIIADLKQQQRIGLVFVCGGSMGGTAALAFAALHPDLVQGVAAMNGTANLIEYAHFQDAISASFGGTKAAIPEEYKKRSAEYWPERLTMPVGLTTGGQDQLVPPASVHRLAAVLKILDRPVRLIHREQGGHATNYADAEAILAYVIDECSRASPMRARPTDSPP
jgi:pimeloyl-ACP methyl ester carboxylesterase